MEITSLPGIGKVRAEQLKNAGIDSLERLLTTLPKSYQDTTVSVPYVELQAGETVCVEGTVKSVGKPSYYGGRSSVRVTLAMEGGNLRLAFFNQPWAAKQYHAGEKICLWGRIEKNASGLVMYCPAKVTERAILPVYHVASIPPKTFREIIRKALEHLDECCPETLPKSLRLRWGLCERNFALRQAHFPESREQLSFALRRIAFEEALLYQAAVRMTRGKTEDGIQMSVPEDAEKTFWQAYRFTPTGAQTRTLREIASDLEAPFAMSRLVQGDVGCGKTAVAFGAMYMAFRAGYQSALMAPTEILARQHAESAEEILPGLGMRTALITGGMKAKERREALDALLAGEVDAVIGTHALLSDDVRFKNVGLVITDEQHRFGVRQRKGLSNKSETPANTLVMSATPIPRTLSLILYGDLDLSAIDEMPPGRKTVKTRLVQEEKREGLWKFIREQAALGHRTYVVCPLVEESENLDAKSAQETYEELKNGPLSSLRLRLVYGSMKEDEKQEALNAFAEGEADVLVSTTVIEVGVNVPSATIMVIEDADRFGLSQLHQLRGRVGRGGGEAWCFLMAEGNDRLRALCKMSSGFAIAEEDLKERGPGDFLGTRQHGEKLLPALMLEGGAQLLEETHACLTELKRPEYREEWETVRALAEAVYLKLTAEIAMN
ncbi:MAG: ATP-dependent DNA helicase RecG [Clostridia bacterium]|nr:ATP-dependent DNA helicase RecG [Clostridia bacterium]